VSTIWRNIDKVTDLPFEHLWRVLGGAVAAALVLGGGLVALQAMAISTGLPFAVVLLLGGAATIYNLIKIHSANKQSTD
jgi:choline-glycine betaine transporter